MKNKHISENVSNFLKPKSEKEINKSFKLDKLDNILKNVLTIELTSNKLLQPYHLGTLVADYILELYDTIPQDDNGVHPYVRSKINLVLSKTYPEWGKPDPKYDITFNYKNKFNVFWLGLTTALNYGKDDDEEYNDEEY